VTQVVLVVECWLVRLPAHLRAESEWVKKRPFISTVQVSTGMSSCS
jgi:hypothetical protein